MILYRVEYPINQRGPYNIDIIKSLGVIEEEIIEEMVNDHRSERTHPSIWLDKPIEMRKKSVFDYYCAFESFDKLLQWFERYIDYLLNMGFQIVEIYVPNDEVFISASGKQAFFQRDNSRVLNVLF